MADGHEDPTGGDDVDGPRDDVTNARGVDGLLSEDFVHDRVPQKLDLGVREGTVLHDLGGSQLLSPVDNRHLRRETGQEQGFLEGGVPAPDDQEVDVAVEGAVASGAGGDAPGQELRLPGHPQHLGSGSRGHDQGTREEEALVDPGAERALGQVDPGGVLGDEHGAEALGLGPEMGHELRTEDALGEAGIVLDVGGQHQLAAGTDPLDAHRPEVGPAGVHRRGQTGGPGSYDDEIVDRVGVAPRAIIGHSSSLPGSAVAHGSDEHGDDEKDSARDQPGHPRLGVTEGGVRHLDEATEDGDEQEGDADDRQGDAEQDGGKLAGDRRTPLDGLCTGASRLREAVNGVEDAGQRAVGVEATVVPRAVEGRGPAAGGDRPCGSRRRWGGGNRRRHGGRGGTGRRRGGLVWLGHQVTLSHRRRAPMVRARRVLSPWRRSEGCRSSRPSPMLGDCRGDHRGGRASGMW